MPNQQVDFDDDDDVQSFVSAAEFAPASDEEEDDGMMKRRMTELAMAIDDDDNDGEIDDLEYLTLDLVNVLPVADWQRLLEVLKTREGKSTDLSKENESLKNEVRSLRSALRTKQATTTISAGSTEDLACAQPPASKSSEETALRADLERRVAALAAERRGQLRPVDELSEDLREAAAETLAFLQDAPRAGADLVKLLAMLTQWLVWSTREDLAPRGASDLLWQVPEETLQFALQRALAIQEEHAGRPEPTIFDELPDCVPIVLESVSDLAANVQVQRVGAACIALGAFSGKGRAALLGNQAAGIKALLAASGRRSRHPELQAWTLVAIGNVALDIPPNNSAGAELAWDAAAFCATAFRNFPSAPEVLERSAHAFAALLHVHPRRVGAVAEAKGVLTMLVDASQRFPHDGQAELHRQLAAAVSALRSLDNLKNHPKPEKQT